MWQQIQLALEQSWARVITKLADLLPGALALILAVIIFTLIALLLSFLLRHLLMALRFDERIGQRGTNPLTEWTPSQSPTLMLSRAVFWGCVILGFVLGITAFDASYGTGLVISRFLLPYVAHTIGAVLILIVGSVIARFLSRSVLIGAVNMNLQYARLLSLGMKWLVLVLAAAMALDHLSIGGAIVELAFGILFGGIVLALALAIGLGSRDMVSRSLERDVQKRSEEATGPLRHF
ncbi:MAG: hypothetical protein ACYC46_12675 [Acidobacteriaceae bacterium]